MITNGRLGLALAAVTAFLAVAIGAFAAHGAKDIQTAETLKTASLYAMTHALAVFAVTALRNGGVRAPRAVTPLFLVGVLFFSGSLVALAFGGPRILGPVTPLGGLVLLSGWALLAAGVLRKPQAA